MKNGVTTHCWLYSGGLLPTAEVDANGAVTTRYVYGARSHVPAYMVRGGSSYRFITDQLGSVRLVVNVADGAIAQRLSYDAWGNVTKIPTRDSSPSATQEGCTTTR